MAKTLRDLPNISTVTEKQLMAVGITTPEELAALGSKEAFFRLRLRDSGACLRQR